LPHAIQPASKVWSGVPLSSPTTVDTVVNSTSAPSSPCTVISPVPVKPECADPGTYANGTCCRWIRFTCCISCDSNAITDGSEQQSSPLLDAPEQPISSW